MIHIIPTEQRLPYNRKEDLFQAYYIIDRNGKGIMAYATGASPKIALRRLLKLLKPIL